MIIDVHYNLQFFDQFFSQVATSLPRQFAVPAHVTDDKLVNSFLLLKI